MAQKINPNALRVGLNKNWKSLWYADDASYTDKLHEDLAIRKRVRQELESAGLDSVDIKRSIDTVEILAYVARPGVAIGRGGSGIEELVNKLKKLTNDRIELKVNEVSKPEISSRIIASEIASGLTRRLPPKLLALSAIQKARAAGADGVRIWVAGRINGNAQARTIKFSEGPIPLQTLRAKIDYTGMAADTSDYGKFGIKVWVYNQED